MPGASALARGRAGRVTAQWERALARDLHMGARLNAHPPVTSNPAKTVRRMQLLLRRLFPLRPLTWRGAVSLMLVAWLVPLVVHLVPWAGARPLGAHLLPAFWAAFVAVYLYGLGGGLVVALTVPVVKFLTGGLPWFGNAGELSLELVLFSGFAALALHRWPAVRVTAPVAWLAAKVAAVGVLVATSARVGGGPWSDVLLSALATALPGLGVLLALNTALVFLLPKERDWDQI